MTNNTILGSLMSKSVELNTYTKKSQLYLAGLAGQNIMYNIISQTFSYYMQFVW